MGFPLVSILWLNYNSMGIMDIVSKSLEALGELDYPSYEVIIVDNGSTDGSFEVIRSIAEKIPVRRKVIRLTHNLGFTGGNNVAYRARDPDSKYIVLLNNDAVPLPESLRLLVECAQSYEAGAAQGVLLDMTGGRVESAGFLVSEILAVHSAFGGETPSPPRRAFKVSYVSGAYSVYDVEALKNSTKPTGDLFYGPSFAYFDDTVLGLEIWNAGYKVVSCPIIAGYHRGSATFSRRYWVKFYHLIKGYYALNEAGNSRYKTLIKQLAPRRALTYPLVALGQRISGRPTPSAREMEAALIRGYRDGVRIGRAYRRWRKPLDIYKAPIIEVEPLEAAYMTSIGLGQDYLRKRVLNRLLEERFKRMLYSGLLNP